MKKTFFLMILATVLLSQSKPSFELPEMNDKKIHRSADIWRSDVSVIVFWNTHCNECIDALKELYQLQNDFRKAQIPVITVNFDLREDLDYAREVAEESPYLVLRDDGSEIAKQWGAHIYSFSAYVLGRDGEVFEQFLESKEGVAAEILESALTYKERKPNFPKMPSFPKIPVPENSRITIFGMGRARYQRVITDEPEFHGPYGEPLTKGGDLKYYFTPRLEIDVTDNSNVGIMFRASNIPSSSILGAPDYFTNYYMSPYINYTKGITSFTAGFYRTNISPFVFYRWSEKDNPPGSGGSEGGCRVCDGLPGGISADNLEDLTPDIGLEGFQLRLNPENYPQNLFYARTLNPDGYCTRYRQHILGLSSTADIWNTKLSANALAIIEDVGNCDRYMGGAGEYRQNLTLGLSSETELLHWLKLNAEYAHAYNEYLIPDTLAPPKRFKNGDAVEAGIFADLELKGLQLKPDLAYLYLTDNFDNPYKALSYRTGYKGIRARGEFIWQERIGALLFYKSLTPVESTDTLSSDITSIGSGLYIDCKKYPIFLGLYYSLDKTAEERDVYTIDISYKPEKTLFLSLNIQHIQTRIDGKTEKGLSASVTTGIDF